jgi:hypothetical protein
MTKLLLVTGKIDIVTANRPPANKLAGAQLSAPQA